MKGWSGALLIVSQFQKRKEGPDVSNPNSWSNRPVDLMSLDVSGPRLKPSVFTLFQRWVETTDDTDEPSAA